MIIFTKKPPEQEVLYAYNNNIIEFTSNVAGQALHAEITIGGYEFVLFPDYYGRFRLNLKNHIPVLINQNNFTDAVPSGSNPLTAVVVNATEGTYLQVVMAIKIHLKTPIAYTDEGSITLPFIKGVAQLPYKNAMQNQPGGSLYLLSPASPAEPYNLTVVDGYPIDMSLLKLGNSTTVHILNESTEAEYSFTINNSAAVRRIYLFNGTNALFNMMPFNYGINNLIITSGSSEARVQIYREKERCGVYIKWFNQQGGWSYHLFDAMHSVDRAFSSKGTLENNFLDVRETVSPQLNVGTTSKDTLTVKAENLSAQDKVLIDSLLESPKIYLFTGETNKPLKQTDWLEIIPKTTAQKTHLPKRDLYNYTLQFTLPERNTLTLWK